MNLGQAHESQIRVEKLRTMLQPYPQVDRFENVGNHAAVHTPHGVAYVLSSLNRIEQRLDQVNFLRADHSTIVRLDAIVSISQSVGVGLTAQLRDGHCIELSRRAARELRERKDVFG
jgi:two-component system, LytTR family, response regulator